MPPEAAQGGFKMKNIIEYFLLFLFLLMFLWVGITYVNQNITVNNARAYKSAMVLQLQNSDFSDAVIQELILKAEEDGYHIEIEDYGFDDVKKIKKVSLLFTYRIPLINYSKDFVIEGYAG